jgi:Family of unknown function (DUF6632)
MNDEIKLRYLRIALYVFGTFFVVGVWTMMQVWPSGWGWEPRQPEYEQMIIGVYATLGFFLILAAKNPLENRSLILFTIWSSVVHAAIMLVQALRDPIEQQNLIGDIPALFLVAIILWFLLPKR